MNIFQKIIVRIAFSLLPILFFSFGLSWSIYMVLGTPQPLEQALGTSGIYQVGIQDTLKNQKDATIGDLPVQQPEIQAIIQKSFPPELLKQDANTIIDGTYAWVQGKTATPQFSVDMSQARTNLADNIATYVQTRSESLPHCVTLPSSLGAINPYTATCLPVQVAPATVGAQAKQEILNSDFMKNPVLTADTLKDSNGKPLAEQLEVVPQAYSMTIRIMYGTGILALILVALIALIQRRQWQIALRHLGILLATVGFISGAVAWVASFVLGKLANKLSESGATNELIQTKIIAIIHTLVDDLRHWWLGYGIVLVVIGFGSWLVCKFIKPRVPSQTPALPVDDFSEADTSALHHDNTAKDATSTSPEQDKPHKPVEPDSTLS